MNDTLTAHAVVPANVTGSVLDATARSFPRVTSSDSTLRRQSLHVGAMSPASFAISHQVRKSQTDVQRTLCKIDQTIARLDALSNPIGFTKFKVAFQTDIPMDVSLTEWRAAVLLLLGALLEGNGAMLDSLYNGEA